MAKRKPRKKKKRTTCKEAIEQAAKKSPKPQTKKNRTARKPKRSKRAKKKAPAKKKEASVPNKWGLTVQEEKYCLYLHYGDRNGMNIGDRRAALNVAYPHTKKWKQTSQSTKAGKLMGKEKIQKYLEALRASDQERHQVTRDELISKLTAMLDVDVPDVIEIRGGELVIKDLEALSPAQRASIKTIKTRPSKYGVAREITLYGKDELARIISSLSGWTRPDEGADGTVIFNLMMQGQQQKGT